MTHMCVKTRSGVNHKRNKATGSDHVATNIAIAHSPLHSLSLSAVLLPTEQLRQAREAAAQLEEIMGQQFIGGSAAAHIDTETYTQERLELLAELFWLLETRSAVGGDEVQRLERLLIEVRGL